MRHFPILYLLLLLLLLLLLFYLSIYYYYYFFWEGSELSIMIATLKKNGTKQPPAIPLKTRMNYVKAKTCHDLFGGDRGS